MTKQTMRCDNPTCDACDPRMWPGPLSGDTAPPGASAKSIRAVLARDHGLWVIRTDGRYWIAEDEDATGVYAWLDGDGATPAAMSFGEPEITGSKGSGLSEWEPDYSAVSEAVARWIALPPATPSTGADTPATLETVEVDEGWSLPHAKAARIGRILQGIYAASDERLSRIETAFAAPLAGADTLREAAERVVAEADVAHSYECKSLRPADHGAFWNTCDCHADTAIAALRAALRTP